MIKIMAALLLVLASASAGSAEPSACAGVEHLPHSDSPLLRVADAMKRGRLVIAVVGSGSSTLGAPAGASGAYPARLQAALAEKLPGVEVKVIPHVKRGQTAAEMGREFGRILSEEQPALVVWQAGTIDAMKGVDSDEFRATLEAGVAALHEGGADALLVNMQYSPRTQSMIAADVYADNMRWVALNQEVPLFDRFAIMRQWSELGVFDLTSGNKDFAQARRVHDCLGRLLADFILEAANRQNAAADVKDSR